MLERNRSSCLPRGGTGRSSGGGFGSGCLPDVFIWRCSSQDHLGGDPSTLEALPLLSPTPRRSPRGAGGGEDFSGSQPELEEHEGEREGTFGAGELFKALQYLGECFQVSFCKKQFADLFVSPQDSDFCIRNDFVVEKKVELFLIKFTSGP